MGAAHLEPVSGVVQLRPEDAMFEAMLRGWKAQQVARGLREDTIAPRERVVRRFLEFTLPGLERTAGRALCRG